jgi:hypothetical protein
MIGEIIKAIKSLRIPASNFCRRCGEELACPCESCEKKNRNRTKWVWTEDGNSCRCPICWFTAHADWWEAWSVDSFDHQLKARLLRAWRISKWTPAYWEIKT